MKKHVILFLATNPANANQEARAIHVELRRSRYRDRFELVTRWAAEPLDLLRELRQLRPTVVHFSGHNKRHTGGASVRDTRLCRDTSDECGAFEFTGHDGMCFQRADGHTQFVSAAALGLTFSAVGTCVKLVVFNTRHSKEHAQVISSYIDCVIGIQNPIRDDEAQSFAIGFYGALGERESVAAAYEQGCAAISLERASNGDRPQLWVRDGIDAGQVILAADRRFGPHWHLHVIAWCEACDVDCMAAPGRLRPRDGPCCRRRRR